MTSITSRILPLLFCAFAISAFAQTQDPGIAISNMDPAVRPGDNFYLYANGAYIARTKLPVDRAAMGVFNTLLDLSFKQIAGIIEDASKANAPAGSDERKIADLYQSYMDEAAIESHGLPALKPPRRNRRHPYSARAGPRTWPYPPCRRRRSQLHQLPYRQHLRSLGRSQF
jgi:putative endopeptidase